MIVAVVESEMIVAVVMGDITAAAKLHIVVDAVVDIVAVAKEEDAIKKLEPPWLIKPLKI